MFMSLQFCFFTSLQLIPKYIDFRPVFFRETHSDMYSTFAYFVSREIWQMPLQLVTGFLFSVLVYFLAGLTLEDDGKRFALFLAMIYITIWLGSGLSEFVSAVGRDAEIANVMGTISLTIMVLFTGFMLVYDAIPKPWIFMYYINVFRYPLSFFMSNELENLKFACPNGDGAAFVNLANSACDYTTPNQNFQDLNCYRPVCPITSGQQILHQFNVDTTLNSQYFGITVVLAVGLRLLALLAMRKLNFINR